MKIGQDTGTTKFSGLREKPGIKAIGKYIIPVNQSTKI